MIFSNESPITGTKMAQIAALSSIGCNLRAIAAIFALNIDLCRRISAKKLGKCAAGAQQGILVVQEQTTTSKGQTD